MEVTIVPMRQEHTAQIAALEEQLSRLEDAQGTRILGNQSLPHIPPPCSLLPTAVSLDRFRIGSCVTCVAERSTCPIV